MLFPSRKSPRLISPSNLRANPADGMPEVSFLLVQIRCVRQQCPSAKAQKKAHRMGCAFFG